MNRGRPHLIVAALLGVAGLIHLLLAPTHLQGPGFLGLGFVVAGTAQLLLAGLLVAAARRVALAAITGLNALLVVGYVLSVTVGLPTGTPETGAAPVPVTAGAHDAAPAHDAGGVHTAGAGHHAAGAHDPGPHHQAGLHLEALEPIGLMTVTVEVAAAAAAGWLLLRSSRPAPGAGDRAARAAGHGVRAGTSAALRSLDRRGATDHRS